MNEFILVAIKLLIGFFALTIIINVSGKGNLSPSSASDQVQNYVLGDIIGDVIYNINTIDLITNNPEKIVATEISGARVRKIVKLPSIVNDYNKDYLQTKIKKSGHNFTVEFATEES